MRRILPDAGGIQQWIATSKDAALAERCVRYALAFNTLDAEWLDGLFSDTVTYESQQVFDILQGHAAVERHLASKIQTLRGSDRAVRFELATTPDGEAIVAGFQSAGRLDRNWLSRPLLNVAMKLDDQQRVTSILIITVAPSPVNVHRSGIFPGIDGAVVERPQQVIRTAANYGGAELVVLLLDGTIDLDRAMESSVAEALLHLPGAVTRTLIHENDGASTEAAMNRAQITGFPSLVAYWHGEIIYRHQGFIPADRLVASIQAALSLYVVTGDRGGRE